MEFQNPSMQGSEVMLCIKMSNARTHRRTKEPEAICPSNFFEVGCIITWYTMLFYFPWYPVLLFSSFDFFCITKESILQNIF